MDYAKRIATLRSKMAAQGVDVVFVANDASWEYLVGLPRAGRGNTPQRQNSLEFSGLMVTEKAVTAFAPRLSAMGYSDHMQDYPQVDKLVIYPDVDINGAHFDSEVTAQQLDGKVMGITRDVSSTQTIRLLEKHSAKLKECSYMLDEMRMIKDDDEIALMRKASEITDQIYHDILPLLIPGTPIRDIEHEIERLLETYDCSCTSFPAEVLNYGPKAGNKIGQPYGVLARDHVIAFDFGVIYKGYCSDFGRTVFLGEPSAKMRHCHELVMQAQAAALEACQIGVTPCCEMNAACHGVMEKAGMAENFIHRMGHCIGKDVHERPFMAEGESIIMQPGMTFTDEPSLFVPGEGLVRVEDVVLCKPDGFEYLNKVTKDIVVLG